MYNEMKIELTSVTIRELVEGYVNNFDSNEAVVAYNGLLNVRPAYQREFIYKEKQKVAVIDTVLRGRPLNTMYWVKNEDGTFGLLDGQQRTLSICEFAEGNVFIKINGVDMNITNIRRTYPEMYERFMNYPLMIYVCEGTKEEQLDWFTVINIAGEALTNQELRNINYTGEWLTDAKRHFSKNNCPAKQIAGEKGNTYITGEYDRQVVLEKALMWITDSRDMKKDPTAVCRYMAEHQFDKDASELWNYFVNVIDWVKETFPNYRDEMKGIEWGFFYNDYHEEEFDPDELEEEIEELMGDYEITSKKGIYAYVLTGEEKYLSRRNFDTVTRKAVYRKQKGICPICGEHFEIKDMEADHIIPWSKGGRTTLENCQMLCKSCNRDKSSGT